MEKTLFVISIALLSISCNDDVAPVKNTNDALVTRVSENGLTRLELFYDDEKRLYRHDRFSSGVLYTYTLYEYNENGLKEMRRYDADSHYLFFRSVFVLDNFGRVIKSENYGTPDLFDKAANFTEFEYNASGQLIAEQFRYGGNFLSRYENTYDGDGNLIKQQRIAYPNQAGEYISALYELTPGPQLVPPSWQDYLFILGLSGHDDEIRYMFTFNHYVKTWDSDGLVTGEVNREMSGHEYDEDGNLIRLVTIRKNLLDPQTTEPLTVTFDYRSEN
jgi:hypothetical protein